jgi:GT2 family glycosyltransferase
MNNTPLVSIIIVNWNGGKYIEKCLESVFAQTFKNFEVILVDNGSTDNSSEKILKQWPDIRFIGFEKNMGFAVANNIAIDNAKGEWLALLNTDAFPEPDWLEKLYEATLKYRDLFFFTSCQIQASAPYKLDGTGDEYNIGGIAWRRQSGESIEQASQTVDEVFSACGAAAFYPREAFLKVGGFDSDFFSYLEDVDLSFRLRLLGYRCLYIPQAKVLHVGSASLGKASEFAIYHSQRNMIWVFLKNMPFPYIVKYLPVHIVMNLGYGFFYGLCCCFCISLKAMKDALLGIPSVLSKRKELQSNLQIDPQEVIRLIRLPQPSGRNLLGMIIMLPKFIIQFFIAVKKCRHERRKLFENVSLL